ALRMRDQRGLDLGGAEPVAGDVDDVVDAASDPVVAVLVAPAAVAGEVLARISLEISIDEALVITKDRAHHSGPTVGNAEIAGRGAFEHLALGINDLRDHPEEWPRR